MVDSKSDEFFFEGYSKPIICDQSYYLKQLDLGIGYRAADYLFQSRSVDTWKIGLAWRQLRTLLFRVMESPAKRAP